MQQNIPSRIRPGLNQCDIDKDRVINFVIFYERGINTIHICITFVYVAALVEGDDLGKEQNGRTSPEDDEADDDCYEPGAFHI